MLVAILGILCGVLIILGPVIRHVGLCWGMAFVPLGILLANISF